VQERIDEARAVKHFQHGRLECGPARLVMRLEPALDHAGPHAVAEKLAGGEQPGRTSTHD